MPKPKEFRTNTALPPVARAANLAILVMKAVKATSWAQVTEELMASAKLNDYQVKLIEEHMAVVSLLRVPLSAKTGDGVTVIVCDKCERIALVSSSSVASKKCTLSVSCKGTVYKAGATQARVAKEAPEEAPEPEQPAAVIYGTEIEDDNSPMIFS